MALGAVVVATVLTLALYQFHAPSVPRIGPFLFLFVVLACAWRCGYAGGIASIVATVVVSTLLTKRTFDPAQIDFYRLCFSC